MALRTAAASKPDGCAADGMLQSKVSVVSEQDDEREAENLVFERMDDSREMGKGARNGEMGNGARNGEMGNGVRIGGVAQEQHRVL